MRLPALAPFLFWMGQVETNMGFNAILAGMQVCF